MKRIVQCPKCEAKLAIFDLGKTINQKCPRCGNAFEIASEENKAVAADPATATTPVTEPAPSAPAPQAETSPAPAPTPEKKKATSKVAAKKGAAPEKETAAPAAAPAALATPAPAAEAPAAAPAAPSAEAKEITVKKPVGTSAKPYAARPASSTLSSESTEPAPAHGVSFLHVMVIFGLLILVIVAQVKSAKKAEARFNALDSQLQEVMKQLQVLSRK